MAKRYVFVGGLQRSGTTLLGRLIAEHSEISGLINTTTREDEGQFVQDVYPDDHKLGGSRRGQAVRWAFNSDAHLTEADLDKYPSPRTRLENAWRPYLSKPNAPIIVEKSPSNLLKTRWLERVFPECHFVIIVRHPITQALAVRKWGTTPMRAGLQLERIVEHWTTAMGAFRSDVRKLRNVKVLSYEQLMLEPARTLVSIQEFVGVPLESVRDQSPVEPSDKYSVYWARLEQGKSVSLEPGRGLNGRARVTLEKLTSIGGSKTVAKVRARFATEVQSFGYDLDKLSGIPDLGWVQTSEPQ